MIGSFLEVRSSQMKKFVEGYDLSTPESLLSAVEYLDRKRQEKENCRELAVIPWVVGMIAVWGIFYFMYFGY